ncbi:UNVERIFIED_CONTAM: hypothetical protein K2H54_003718 [Gekko kuhli]
MALVTLQRSPTPSAASSSASNSELEVGSDEERKLNLRFCMKSCQQSRGWDCYDDACGWILQCMRCSLLLRILYPNLGTSEGKS